jgi:hypothetical protein
LPGDDEGFRRTDTWVFALVWGEHKKANRV